MQIDYRRLIFLESADCSLKAIEPQPSQADKNLLPFEAVITTATPDLDGETVKQGRWPGGEPRIDFSYYMYKDPRLGRARGNVHEGHTPRDTGVIPPGRMLGFPVSADVGQTEAMVRGFFNANPALPGGNRSREIWTVMKEMPGAYNPSFEAQPIRNDRNPRIVEGSLVTGLAVSDKVKTCDTALAAGWGQLILKAIEAAGDDMGGGYQGNGELMPQDRGQRNGKGKRRRNGKRAGKPTHCRKGCDALQKAVHGAESAEDAIGRCVLHLQEHHGMTAAQAVRYFHTHILKGRG